MINAKTYAEMNISYSIKQDNVKNILHKVLEELRNTRFCPSKIINYVKDCNQYLIVSAGPITLHYIYKDQLDESLHKILRTLKQCILLHKHFKIKHQFNIFIMFTPFKRYICKNKPIDSININGGFTSLQDNNIFILRKEEYKKVILHEMLHHVKDVHNENWSSKCIKELKTAFNISPTTRLIPNEAVVELWATIYYVLFLSFEYKTDFKSLLNIELNFSMYQSSKLLKKQNNKPWFEYTNAYCYIVFKTILLKAYIENMLPPNLPESICNYLINHKNDVSNEHTINDNSLRMMKLSDL